MADGSFNWSPQPSGAPNPGSFNIVDKPNVDKFRSVAKFQRRTLWSLLGMIVLTVIVGMTTNPNAQDDNPIFKIVVGLLGLLLLIAVGWSVFGLARNFYGLPAVVAWIIMSYIPYVGLLALLVLNQKATKYLQKNGIKVGLMGVNPNSIH